MSRFVFAPPASPGVAIVGSAERFPVHRIYCVGLNYADHIREMGSAPTPPVFFMKPADAVVANGAAVPYPPATANFHYEIELVVAIARAGRDIAPAHALEHVFGYAVGNDLTRRDLQAAAKERGQPWDIAKGFRLFRAGRGAAARQRRPCIAWPHLAEGQRRAAPGL